MKDPVGAGRPRPRVGRIQDSGDPRATTIESWSRESEASDTIHPADALSRIRLATQSRSLVFTLVRGLAAGAIKG